MAEEWIEKVFEVQRASNRIILVKSIVGQRVVTFLIVYAPQSGLTDVDKDLFFVIDVKVIPGEEVALLYMT